MTTSTKNVPQPLPTDPDAAAMIPNQQDDATESAPRPQFGEVVLAESRFVAWDEQQRKFVDFNPALHTRQSTEVSFSIAPLRGSFSDSRTLRSGRSKEWQISQDSWIKIGYSPKQLQGRFVRYTKVPSGSIYLNAQKYDGQDKKADTDFAQTRWNIAKGDRVRYGELLAQSNRLDLLDATVEATAIQFNEVFPTREACEQAANAYYGSSSQNSQQVATPAAGSVPGQTYTPLPQAPLPASLPSVPPVPTVTNDQAKAFAQQSLLMMWNAAVGKYGPDDSRRAERNAEFLQAIENNPFVKQYFGPQSPEVTQYTGDLPF